MKIFKSRVLYTLLVLCAGINAKSQELEEANKYYADYQYDFAIPHFLKAIDKKPTREIIEKLADCYRLVNDSKEAENWYGRALTLDSTRQMVRYYYAEALRNNGKYDEAYMHFSRYLRQVPGDSIKIKRLLQSCKESKEWIANPQGITISNENGLNTKYSEFSPIVYKKGILFTSDRIANKKGKVKEGDNYIFGWTGNPYLKMFYSEYKPGSWNPPIALEPPVNTAYHNGPASFDAAHKLLCFSRTVREKKAIKISPLRLKNNDPVNRKQLFFATESGDGKWTDVKPFKYNDPANYSVQHPAFSQDGRYLYFSSDKPGGFGKFDLYVSEKLNDSTWSTPMNLGDKINTSEDEGFPVITKDNMLYFSSGGHVGMGGMDLFSAVGKVTTWSEVQNLQYPFNSSKDDFGILFLKNKEIGFISSNRDGGLGGDDILRFKVNSPSCTLKGVVIDSDIEQPIPGARIVFTDKKGQIQEVTADSSGAFKYSPRECDEVRITAYKPSYSSVSLVAKGTALSSGQPLKLEMAKGLSILLVGKVLDKSTGLPIPKALISIIETSGDDGDKFLSDKDGVFSYPLKKKKKYKVVAVVEGYLPDKTFVDTYEIKKSTVLNTTLYLDRIEVDKTVVLRDIYYDRNKFNIRKDAAAALEEVLNLMNLNPTLKLEIGSHTDSRAKEAYNKKLSEKRAQAVVKYLTGKGISKSRLIAKGYGETQLLNQCKSSVKCSEEEHQLNRRTEFKVLGIINK